MRLGYEEQVGSSDVGDEGRARVDPVLMFSDVGGEGRARVDPVPIPNKPV